MATFPIYEGGTFVDALGQTWTAGPSLTFTTDDLAGTLTLRQLDDGVIAVWALDTPIEVDLYRVSDEWPTKHLGTFSATETAAVDLWSYEPGEVATYVVYDAATMDALATPLTMLDLAAAGWCSIVDVKALLVEPYPDDAEIVSAIQTATAALDAAFCVDVAVDSDGYATDWKVRQATAVMASQILTAAPAGSAGPVESETLGGYSYRTVAPRSSHTATRVDGYIAELVGGYLCPGEGGLPFDIDVMTPDDETVEEEATV